MANRITIEGVLYESGDVISIDMKRVSDNFFTTIIGKIAIESTGEIYLCHNNEMYNGAFGTEQKFGYKYGWVFRVTSGGKINDPEYIQNIKKLKDGYFTLNNQIFRHGDSVIAQIPSTEDSDITLTVEGKICINPEYISETYLYICQNKCNGDDAAYDKFGYNYSWSFKVEQGSIISVDTYSIIHKEEDPKQSEVWDDDPMPMDWVCEEKIPDDL